MNQLVSIVTPVYNAEKYLEATLDSVLKQTYLDWEHLLVIDANTSDRSLEIAKRYAGRDPRYRILQSPNYKGVANNRNAGIDTSRGQYIAFLDADDLWLPEKLTTQIKFMNETKTPMSCHEFTPIDNNGHKSGPTRTVPQEIKFDTLLEDNAIGCTTAMLRRDFLGNRRFQQIKHEDFALWLTLLRDGAVAKGIQKELALYRVTGSSLSGNKLKSAIWRWKVYRFIGLPLGYCLQLMAKYALYSLGKRVGILSWVRKH
jgi:teichuronic acid biosynthesis glycosyltransferase TuaG